MGLSNSKMLEEIKTNFDEILSTKFDEINTKFDEINTKSNEINTQLHSMNAKIDRIDDRMAFLVQPTSTRRHPLPVSPVFAAEGLSVSI
jgi:methyl-accepting chemotaxis protein